MGTLGDLLKGKLRIAAILEVIRNAAPIKRAHPRFVENLRELGARIDWSGGD